MRALLAVLLMGCAAKPAVGERCPGGMMAASPFCPAPPCVAGEVRDRLKNRCVRVLTLRRLGAFRTLHVARLRRYLSGRGVLA